MIHHDTKYMSFGTGDICVGSDWTSLTFQNIKPPQEVGTHLFRGQDGVEFLGDIIHLEFTDICDINVFSKALKQVEDHETDCFSYKGWTLYFMPGSDKSAEVVRTHFTLLTMRMCQCLAC